LNVLPPARPFLGLLRSLLIYYAVPGRARAMRHLFASFLGPGDVVFDVGAHVGSRVRVMRALGARVVAIEPQPLLARWLHWVYGRDPLVTILPAAVGQAEADARLFVSSRTPTVSTLSQSWMAAVARVPSFAGVQWDTAVPIKVTTLDALVAAYGRPAFCKIDVEGYETAVLQGLSQPLPALSFEYIPAVKERAVACVLRLSELGTYRFNWSPGEAHKLQSSHWLTAAEITAVLQQMAQMDKSGDVYARLEGG